MNSIHYQFQQRQQFQQEEILFLFGIIVLQKYYNSVRKGGKFYGGNCGQDAGWSTGGGSGYYGGAGSSGGGEVHSSILHLSKTEKQLQVTKKCLHLFQKQKTSLETEVMDTSELHLFVALHLYPVVALKDSHFSIPKKV